MWPRDISQEGRVIKTYYRCSKRGGREELPWLSNCDLQECTNQNCNNNGQLYDGNRYSCSLVHRTGDDLDEYTADHRFCLECADLPAGCPSAYCGGAAYRLHVGYPGHERPNPI